MAVVRLSIKTNFFHFRCPVIDSMLKYVKKVHLGFIPGKPSSKSAQVFLSRLVTDKNKASNPKCEFLVNVSTTLEKPFLKVDYTNGHTLDIKTASYDLEEMCLDFMRIPNAIQIEEDIKNVS